jgi:hypothetical protein
MEMKRILFVAAYAVALALMMGVGATPAKELNRSGDRPTLSVTVTDGGIWTWPALEAGAYDVRLDNLTERKADLLFVRVPDGWTPERYAGAASWEIDAAYLFGETAIAPGGRTTREVAGRVASRAHSTGHGEVTLRPGTWLLTPAGAVPGVDYAVIEIDTAR